MHYPTERQTEICYYNTKAVAEVSAAAFFALLVMKIVVYKTFSLGRRCPEGADEGH